MLVIVTLLVTLVVVKMQLWYLTVTRSINTITHSPRMVEVLTLIICYIIMVPLVEVQVLLLQEVVTPQ